MNTKALTFVINGMLTNEHNTAVQRLAFLLSKMPPNTVNCFCEGIVTDIHGVSTESILAKCKEQNKGKVLNKVLATEVNYVDDVNAFLRVKLSRTVWKKDLKDWQKKDKKEGEYEIEVEDEYWDNIYFSPYGEEFYGVILERI